MNRIRQTIEVSEPLWQALELMSRDMGVDRDALVAQALFQLARQNGYVTPTVVPLSVEPGVQAPRPRTPAPVEVVTEPDASDLPSSAPAPAEAAAPPPSVASQLEVEAPAASGNDESPELALARMREILAEVELVVEPQADVAKDASDDDDADSEDEGEDASDDDDADSEDESDDADEEEATGEVDLGDVAADDSAETTRIVEAPGAMEVFVRLAQGEPVEVSTGRFTIGRGPRCNLVVKSGRVSREHAVVFREGDEVFIEDLNSSNGTWFAQERITRHKVSDGDELMLGTEAVFFTVRPRTS